jgi:phosphomethylpyrimidine synthase
MALRDSWIQKREAEQATANGNGNSMHASEGLDATAPNGRNMSQMHLARRGAITEEMAFVAGREKLEPELIRDEIARGRCIIPANIHHRNLQPMAIGIATKCKINANIGNSATSSNIDEELKKLHHAVHYGADTVMDLSTGGDIPKIRKAITSPSTSCSK